MMRAARSVVVALALVLGSCGEDDSAVPTTAVGRDAGFRGTAASPAVVWAVGDGANGTPDAKALARRIAADDPDRVLYLGDVYETGTLQEFKTNMAGVYKGLTDRILPTPGNHDWPNHERGYDRFWDGAPPWYGVRIGAWDVLSLNSEARHDGGSRQVRWLRRRMERPSTCRLAFWHRPRYNAGVYGDLEDVAPLWNAVAGDAELVLSGHDHNSQRLRPIGGTAQIVAGAGGRERYPVDETDPRLKFADDRRFMAVRLVLGEDGAQLAFTTAKGKVLDRARIPCRG